MKAIKAARWFFRLIIYAQLNNLINFNQLLVLTNFYGSIWCRWLTTLLKAYYLNWQFHSSSRQIILKTRKNLPWLGFEPVPHILWASVALVKFMALRTRKNLPRFESGPRQIFSIYINLRQFKNELYSYSEWNGNVQHYWTQLYDSYAATLCYRDIAIIPVTQIISGNSGRTTDTWLNEEMLPVLIIPYRSFINHSYISNIKCK